MATETGNITLQQWVILTSPVAAGAVIQKASGSSWDQYLTSTLARWHGQNPALSAGINRDQQAAAQAPQMVSCKIPYGNIDNMAPRRGFTEGMEWKGWNGGPRYHRTTTTDVANNFTEALRIEDARPRALYRNYSRPPANGTGRTGTEK